MVGQRIRSFSDFIHAAAFDLARLRDHLIPVGADADTDGGVVYPYEVETELRKEYRAILSHILSERGVVQMDDECNMRALVSSAAWDALPEVRLLRQIFDSEGPPEAVSTTTSTSTSVPTSATSRRSMKLGPHTPDLSARKVQRRGVRTDLIQLSAVGEIKLDNFEGSYGDGQVAMSDSAQACREAQLLEGMCQIIWYVWLSSRLFGTRMGILMINGSFKRFFLVNSTTLAVEVSPDLLTETDMMDGLDVDTLSRGMRDSACHLLCTLPNRLFALSPPQSTSTSTSTSTSPLPTEYDLPVLERLFHFWAEALGRAKGIPHDRPRGDTLQRMPIPSMPHGTLRVNPNAIAFVGRLKHLYNANLQRHSKSKGKRPPPSVDHFRDDNHGDDDDDDDDDGDGDGDGGANARRDRRTTNKVPKREGSRKSARLAATTSQRAPNGSVDLRLALSSGRCDNVRDRIISWRARIDHASAQQSNSDRLPLHEQEEAEAAMQPSDCHADALDFELEIEAAAMRNRTGLLLAVLRQLDCGTILYPVTPTEMDALILPRQDQDHQQQQEERQQSIDLCCADSTSHSHYSHSHRAASSESPSSSLTGPPTPVSPGGYVSQLESTAPLDGIKGPPSPLHVVSRVCVLSPATT